MSNATKIAIVAGVGGGDDCDGSALPSPPPLQNAGKSGGERVSRRTTAIVATPSRHMTPIIGDGDSRLLANARENARVTPANSGGGDGGIARRGKRCA